MGDVTESPAAVYSGVIVRHCDVCYLLDGNTSPKEVKYCALCDAFMCDTCRVSLFRRSLAAFSRKFSRKLKGA